MAKQTSILQPDDSLEILVAGNSSSTYRKTIRQIINNYKSQINNNANVFMFIPWSASGHTYDYYYIYGFQIYDEITDVYLRNDITVGYTNSLYILPKNNATSQSMSLVTSEAYYISENTLNTGYSLRLRNVDQYDNEIYYGFWYSWVDNLNLPNIIYVDIPNITIYRNGIAPSPSSNWVSVQSISGKNGILLMPTLIDTNNGNPVTGASSSTFTKAPSAENNIKNLVDLSLEPTNTDDSATIFYTIPDGTYTSIKLYGKIGENPKCNSTDDIIEDINQNDTSISIENLECEEYYFCIQAVTTDLTLSSNVVSIDLSFNWDGSEITILWSGDNNRMTAELIESNGDKHIKFRMYLSDTLIYQFIGQYVDESLSRTVKDINIGFLIDENNQIGRPSNIYYVSDEYATNYQKYIYNASDETPTESEMQDIYTWLVAGMD